MTLLYSEFETYNKKLRSMFFRAWLGRARNWRTKLRVKCSTTLSCFLCFNYGTTNTSIKYVSTKVNFIDMVSTTFFIFLFMQIFDTEQAFGIPEEKVRAFWEPKRTTFNEIRRSPTKKRVQIRGKVSRVSMVVMFVVKGLCPNQSILKKKLKGSWRIK